MSSKKSRITIKLSYNGKVKPNVWRYDDIPNWIYVQSFVKRTFSLREFKGQYVDADGDRVTIVEMPDLQEMFEYAHKTGKKEMTVYIGSVTRMEPYTVDEQDVSYVTQELRALKQQLNLLERKSNAVPSVNADITRQEIRVNQQTINALESSLDNMLRLATLVNTRNQKEVKKDRVAYDSGTIEPFVCVMGMDRLVTGYIHKCMQCVPKEQYFITPSWAIFSAIVMSYSGNLVKKEENAKEIAELNKLNRTLTSKLNVAEYHVSQRQVVLKPEDYGHWSDDDDRYLNRNDDDGYWS